MTNYRKATNHVCDIVEGVIDKNGKLDFPESTFADSVLASAKYVDVRYTKPLNSLPTELETSGPPYFDINPAIAYYLVALAEFEAAFFDYCAKICSTNIKSNVHLVEPLNNFASDVLMGKKTRPRKRSRPRKSDWLGKSFLWSLTDELVKGLGLNLTRNDEPPAKSSACDAVAEALTVCGRKTNYAEIKNLMVHPDSARLRKEFVVRRRIYNRWHNTDPPQNALRPEFHEFWFEAEKADVLDILSTFPTADRKTRSNT